MPEVIILIKNGKVEIIKKTTGLKLTLIDEDLQEKTYYSNNHEVEKEKDRA
jgi:hypothetical protein